MHPDSPLILFGKVKDTKDPDSLGRVQVTLTTHGVSVDLPWIRVLQPIASKQKGFFFLPEIGDEVAVARGLGNSIDGMLVIGAVYNADNKPKVPDGDGKNNIKQIVTRTGTEFTLDDTDGAEKITLQTGDTKLSLVFDKAAGEITLTGDKKITIKCTTDVLIDCKNCDVTASGNVTVKASQNVSIEGTSKVDIKGGAATVNLAASGGKVDGGAKLDLVGGMINIG